MKACSVFILIVLAVVAGLALGLFVGWVVWPVQWIDASPADMRTEFQMDWVNMAIDSYSVNQNAQLAAERFTYLGKDGPRTLAAVVANPTWVSEADALAYSEAVKQELGPAAVAEAAVATNAPSLSSRLLKQPLFGYVVVALFLALLAIVLLVILVIRLFQGKKEEPIPEVAPIAAVAVAEPVLTESPTTEVEPTRVEITAGEEAPEPEQGGVSAGEVAAAGVVAAGVAAAAEAGGEPEAAGTESGEVEEAIVPETEEPESEISAVAAGEPSEGGPGTMAKILAGGAAVAGIADAVMKPEEEKEGVTAPDETAGVVSAVEEVAVGKPEFEGVVDTVEGAMEDTKPIQTAATAGAALAGVEWALEGQSKDETGEIEATPPELTEPVPAESVTQPGADEWIPETPTSELDQGYLGKYNRKVIDIEGIGEAYADRLAEAGITTTHALLQQCATSKGRDDLAKKTGISGKLILEWANHADMMRVQGIGPQWSDLLEMAGVNTVRELALRNPSNLYQKLVEINDQKNLVRKLPTETQLEDWVEQAKDLPRILTY